MMVTITEAEAHLSELIERVCHGEKIVIAKDNRPLVDLVAHAPTTKRTLGLLAGKFELPSHFNAPDAHIERMFYGDGA